MLTIVKGKAATHIGGSTLHSTLEMKVFGDTETTKPMTGNVTRNLQAKWAPREYLLIDEISMVSSEFTTAISKQAGIAKSKRVYLYLFCVCVCVCVCVCGLF